VGGYERCSFDARLRLIESIIDEGVVAPDIHKRVLWNEDIQSAHQHIKKGRKGRQTSVSPGFEPG
jgi:hypothetical protein